METVRLRKIQQPSQVERLLEAFVTRGSLLSKECYQIRASGALSPRERGAPVLQVDLYDEAGELKDAGIWMTDQQGKWSRGVA